MILPWTSSVNNISLPSSGLPQNEWDETYTYEDVMKYHIWNLYSELSSSGWVPMSSSYSSSSGYVNARNWPSVSNLSFPNSMADSLEYNDLFDQKDIVYTPSEHCWVTLKKSFSATEIYYLTIDCRYPLPPHKSNTGLIVDMQIDNFANISYVTMSNGEELKLFVGPTSIQKLSTAVKSDETIVSNVWRNTQEINALDGVCVRDNLNTKFSITPPAIIANGQDYISRCVSFVDICILRANDLVNDTDITRVTQSDLKNYTSATTRVRPKKNKDDENAWYICWGFDYLDSPEKYINDKIKLQDYKYAFHKDGNGHFIYQIYKNNDKTFRSGFGFLPVQNKNSNDLSGKTSFCINCDPAAVYDSKSINFNTLGNEVILVTGSNLVNFQNNISTELSKLKQGLTTVNNYFNTCYRNYNFSDGKSCIKAGAGGNIGQYMELPIYAPVSPKDSAYFLHSASYVSSTKINPFHAAPINITFSKKFNRQTETDPIVIPSKNFSIRNSYKRKKDNFIIKIPRNATQSYMSPVYIQESITANKKVLIGTDGRVLKTSADKISAALSLPSLIGNPFYLSSAADGFSSFSALFKEIFTTVSTVRSSRISEADFISLFDPALLENSKNIRIYVGSYAGKNYIPYYWSSGANLWADNTTLYGPAGSGKPYTSKGDVPRRLSSLTEIALSEIRKLYIDDPTRITAANGWEYLAYTDLEMAGAIVLGSKNNRGIYSTQDVSNCYIDVPLSSIYNLLVSSFVDEDDLSTIEEVTGDFDKVLPGPSDLQVRQDKGANFFSVFKSTYSGKQQPLGTCIYSFSQNINSVSDVSMFGTISKDKSSDNRLISNRDANSAYPELPMFLVSLNDSGLIKGYATDITWAPSGVSELSVVADNSIGATKNYKKVYWGGCWFPWVSDYAPEL